MIRPSQHVHPQDPEAAAAMAACDERVGLWAGQAQSCRAHEAAFGELALVCPDGRVPHALDWQSERPVALLRHVQRLTAPNPGTMTGPGTNSYVVGDAATGFVVIDAGPDIPAHVQRLWQTTGGDVRAIVCTHSHPDHAPGAWLLQRLCAHTPPVLGLPSGPFARADSQFVPDLAWRDGQQWVLQGPHMAHTLRAVHTPGHTANHLCVVLQEDGLLFSGDHVLNGSTTVIDPPDGDMGDYMASLDVLAQVCVQGDVQFILPAHGHVLGSAGQALAALKAHRLRREAKVSAAMQALPQGSLQQWVAHAYSDVPEHLWPVAQRSLQAHVAHLRRQETP